MTISLGMLSLMFLFFYFYTTSLHWRGLRIKYRLLRIEEYETSIRVKWGDDALEEFQTAAERSPYTPR
jgi:sensor histidine kinase YesM